MSSGSSQNLLYFSSIPLETYEIKLANSSSNLIYSQVSAEEKEDDFLNNIEYISTPKFFELVTSHDYQNSEFFNTLLYGSCSFLADIELFSQLIQRFRLVSPLNLSKNESLLYAKKVLKTIQIKVLIFLQQWFKLHKNSLILCEESTEAAFVETLYCLVHSKAAGKWIEEPISRFFDELEELAKLRAKEKLFRKKLFLLTSNTNLYISKAYHLIRHRKKELAQCLCLYDQRNFERIGLRELFRRNYRGVDNKNYHKFIDSFNFLSKFASFLILFLQHSFTRIALFEDFVDIVEDLLRMNNFHSSYAIFLGITYSAVARLKPVLEQKLSKNYKNKLEKLTNFFDKSGNFKEIMNKSLLPAVPALGFFTKELALIEEMSKLYGNSKESAKFAEKNMANFAKLQKIAAVLRKVDFFRSCRYNFGKKFNDEFLHELNYIPNFDEDTLYELSKKIL